MMRAIAFRPSPKSGRPYVDAVAPYVDAESCCVSSCPERCCGLLLDWLLHCVAKLDHKPVDGSTQFVSAGPSLALPHDA